MQNLYFTKGSDAELFELSDADVKQANSVGIDAVEAFLKLESELLGKGLTARRGSTAHKHGQMVTKPNSLSASGEQRQNLLNAVHNIATLKHLQQKYNFVFHAQRNKFYI